MTKQTIDNLQPGTLDGDSLFETAEKINQNFNEIYSHFGDGLALDNGYVGLKGLDAGIIVSQGLNTYTSREILSSGSSLQITNGTGATGNPTIDLSETGVLSPGTSPTLFADVGLTVDVHGRITAISTPTLLTSASAQASAAGSSATAAATQATNAATSATASAASATSAANDVATIGTSLSQAATHATNAGTSATSAAASATTAQNQVASTTTNATNASNSETASATSATNSANSATAAATSATNASGSASAAATSATNAAASLASMSTNTTAAQNAANSAAASFDAFDDIFLGAKSSAPIADNDGDALQTGALYFNTASDTMFIRTSGGSWTAAGSAVNGTTNRSSYVATANQTTFAAVYDVGYLDVYLNGIKLSAADFTANNGTSFVLASGAGVGDQVDAIGYGAFSVANVYTKTEADNRYLDASLNLSDLASATTAKTNLGLHAVATSGNYNDLSNLPTISTTATNVAGGSSNGILYQSGASTTAHLAAGTSGYILQTNGAGSAPTWVAKSSVASPTGVATIMKFS